jgi:hypothetical protein
VGGPDTRGLRRSTALIAVIVLHTGLVSLLVTLRTSTRRPPPSGFVSTFIALPPPSTAPSPRSQVPRTLELPRVAPIEPLIEPPPQIAPLGQPDRSIDWDQEAQRSAAAITEPGTYRQFGHTAKVEAATAHRPRHEAGEQYRLATGEWVVWVSERCYIVSGVPPIGLPDVLARSIPTTTVCRDDSPPPGALFKDLPAYRKYQAAPGVK